MAGKATSVGVWALFVEYTIADSIVLHCRTSTYPQGTHSSVPCLPHAIICALPSRGVSFDSNSSFWCASRCRQRQHELQRSWGSPFTTWASSLSLGFLTPYSFVQDVKQRC